MVVGETEACGCLTFRVAPTAQWATLAASAAPAGGLTPPAAHAATEEDELDERGSTSRWRQASGEACDRDYDTVEGAVSLLEDYLVAADALRERLALVLAKAKANVVAARLIDPTDVS